MVSPPPALGGAPVSLTKNQRVELQTQQAGQPVALNRITMQLGWESGPVSKPVDLDASVIASNADGE